MNDKKRAQARRRQRKLRRQRRNAVIRLAAVMASLLVVAAAVILVAPKRGDRALGRPRVEPEVEIAGPVITLEPEPEEIKPSAPDTGSALRTAAGTANADAAAQTAGGAAPAGDASATGSAPTAAELLADDIPTATDVLQSDPMAHGGERTADGFEYLPVFKRAETLDKVIAITVDDCFQIGNLRTIISTAYDNKGRLTLFPIGENLSKSGMKETLQGALKAKCEIENHTWSHSRIFRLPEMEMAEEIWKQGEALNELLGMNYREHFFRLMGGDGSSDQRTHNYLEQLGFYGIADWAVSGSDSTLEAIKKSLAPGLIYLFHTTDGDTQKLQQFIPYAVSQGYELVTLNELLGYPENETSQYAESTMPVPQPFVDEYRVHKMGDYAWNIVRMQDKLRELGFLEMEGESTGYYGEKTADAIKKYQISIGFNPTGIADAETQQKLLS